MNDQDNGLNSKDAMTALTVAYIGWMIWELAGMLGFGRAFRWYCRAFMYLILGMTAWVLAGKILGTIIDWVAELPSWAQYTLGVIILVFILGIIILVVYNAIIETWNKWKTYTDGKKFEIENKQKLSNAIKFIQPWLSNLEFHYYNFEKEKFVQYLLDSNCLISFHLVWDEAYRLQKMGEVTGKAYVCHLNSKPSPLSREGREAAWQQKRREQSERDLKRNAELKAARKSLIKK